ncbi:metalloaminopeptidase [Malassezia pachydermatis]|uniref:leucyl aminopeptidase n=1 Tax=Malassezia pachydermatis TaxID=77020 RepID=A0A0M8MML7_9BASI|nr:cytosol aminopeptidase [Malassezia pachydermatis]KOS15546.1 cytosol aminopeptidase [Malassezia pachydermatis]
MANLLGKVVRIDADGAAPALSALPEVAAQVKAQWQSSRASAAKAGELRVLYPTSSDPIAAVATGEQHEAPTTGPDALPPAATFLRNERLEQTRLAAAKGVRALRDLGKDEGERQVHVDTFSSAHAAAVGSILGLWNVNHFKTRGSAPAWGQPLEKQGGRHIEVVPLSGASSVEQKKKLLDDADDLAATTTPLSWYTGEVYAKAQNWSRELQETPANLLTPAIFAERVQEAFKHVPNTQVKVHDADWAREQNMNLFLSVAQGSDQPCKFVEIQYHGAPDHDAAPLALVGKGVTFDSGGISLKPGAGMDLMRADMGGAAAVVASTLAIAQLGLPINLVTVMPLTENMPSGRATKPGDVFQARNGLTVVIDNTDAEGRLILADALSYVSDTYKPHTVIDVATLTGACVIALGDVYSGVFTETESLWQELKVASEAENDLCWRMPLTDRYLTQISKVNADLVNTGGRPAGSCTAAVFLKQFVHGLGDRTKGEAPSVRYAHIDIAGSMEAAVNTLNDYQGKGLTGRPVRALIEFARRLAYQS